MEIEEADGSDATVVSNTTSLVPQGVTVYNFTVDSDHTYFVEQNGGDGLWVHNAAECVKFWKAYGSRELLNPSGKFSVKNIQEMLAGRSPKIFAEIVNRKTGAVLQKAVPIQASSSGSSRNDQFRHCENNCGILFPLLRGSTKRWIPFAMWDGTLSLSFVTFPNSNLALLHHFQ